MIIASTIPATAIVMLVLIVLSAAALLDSARSLARFDFISISFGIESSITAASSFASRSLERLRLF